MEHDRRRRVESRTGGAQSARALAGKGAARWISATALNEHQPLNGALTRLQATAIRNTIRLAEPWRCRQISRINEWSGEGMEFVLPESFCRSALDRRLVVALDAVYFALSVGIERWLYRLARSTRSGSQTARISGFGISVGRARVSHVSDFALDIGRIVARQLLRKLSPSAEKHCAESDRRKTRPIVGTAPELCRSTDLMVHDRARSAAKILRWLPAQVFATAAVPA
jgi:hypothetical protein